MNLLLYRGEKFDANHYYQSGVDIDHAFFLLLDGKKILLVPRMNEAIARKNFKGKVIAYVNAAEELKKLVGKRLISIDEMNMPYYLAKKLSTMCRLENASERLLAARMKKMPEEIRAVAKATKTTHRILDSLELKEGMSELYVVKQLRIATVEAGTEQAFEPIVATAANARFPHYTPGKSRLKDMVLIDYGVKNGQYCSDVTRCFFLRRNSRMQQAYEKLQSVSDEIMDALPQLHTGKDLAQFAEKSMAKQALPKLIHSIGHGIGLDVHEYPRMSMKSGDGLKNTTIAIEPGAYFSNFGVRYENTLHFDGKKARIL